MDPMQYLEDLLAEGLKQLEMGFVDPKYLAGHITSELLGAAKAFDAAELLPIERARPILDRLGDELVARGLAERVSASMSASVRLTAVAATAPRSRLPVAVPREPVAVSALMLDGSTATERRFVLTSLERWTDGFLLRYWASPPVTPDSPEVGSLTQLDWHAGDDHGSTYDLIERRHSAGGDTEVGAVRFAPPLGDQARHLTLEAAGPEGGDVLLRARIPLEGSR